MLWRVLAFLITWGLLTVAAVLLAAGHRVGGPTDPRVGGQDQRRGRP